jgi:ATP-dependent RNA helicase RhlB
MLFSATLSNRVLELCYEHMNVPERFSATPKQVTVEQIEQEIYHVGKSEKFGLLLGILRHNPHGRFLIFSNTRSTAERLETLLKANGLATAAITGDLPQKKRMKVLSQFKEGTLPILVATDVASRGLHIDGVSHVINYDLPQDAEDYVHRIGRTARAGAGGKAVSLACEEYVHSLADIEDFIGQKIPVASITDEMIITGYKRAFGREQRRGHLPSGKDRRKKSPMGPAGSGPSPGRR